MSFNLDSITAVNPIASPPRFYLTKDYSQQYPGSGLTLKSVVVLYLGDTFHIPENDSLAAGRYCVAVTTSLDGGGKFYVVVASDLAPAPPHATNA